MFVDGSADKGVVTDPPPFAAAGSLISQWKSIGDLEMDANGSGTLIYTDGGNIAELGAVESNLLAFAGEKDALVPPSVAEKGVELVASKDKEFRIAPGGHMGVILGSKAQKAEELEVDILDEEGLVLLLS